MGGESANFCGLKSPKRENGFHCEGRWATPSKSFYPQEVREYPTQAAMRLHHMGHPASIAEKQVAA
jgi:hypothetical protein